jgi:hypothetical protein
MIVEMKNWIDELKIKVTSDQKRWLEFLYEKLVTRENMNYRLMGSELHKHFPEDFDPSSIDDRFVSYSGSELTLLGFEFLHPERKIIEKLDLVIRAIKELLLENPSSEQFEITQISDKTSVDPKELDLLLLFLTRFREPSFSNGSSGNSEYMYHAIRVSNEETFNNYLNYKKIDDVIEAQLFRKEKADLPPPKLKTKTRVIKGVKGGILGNQYFIEEEVDEEPAGIYVKPIFTSPVPKINQALCFVLMPFGETWSNEVWSNMIRPSVEGLGLQCMRADSIHGMSIIEDIWTSMNQSAFIIADLTKVNPNVMYEMGIVHTIGKPSILITQDISSKPFDVSHLRQYPYEVTPSGASKFKAKPHEVIRDIYSKNYPEFALKH